MTEKKAYISGPMSGKPEKNRAEFDKVALEVEQRGYVAVLPHTKELENDDKATWQQFMREDLKMMMDCDVVVVLDGWQRSPGSRDEVHTAQRYGIPVYDRQWNRVRLQFVGEQAEALVYGGRREDYGSPEVNIGRIALKWTGHLYGRLREGEFITKRDVCAMMVDVKTARLSHAGKMDSVVDISGYAELMGLFV